MATVESGTRVRLAFTREAVAGTTPAGIGTVVTDIAATATGDGGAGFADRTGASARRS